MTTKLLSEHELFTKYGKELTEKDVDDIIFSLTEDSDGSTLTYLSPDDIIDTIWTATDENTILMALDKYFDHVLEDMTIKEGRPFETNICRHFKFLLVDVLNDTIEEKFEEFDIHVDRIIRNSFAHARQKAQIKYGKENGGPDAATEVQPKAKKPQEEPKQENEYVSSDADLANRKMLRVNNIIRKATHKIKVDEPVNDEVQEEPKNQEPDEVIEVQSKAKKQPKAEQKQEDEGAGPHIDFSKFTQCGTGRQVLQESET